MSEADPTRCLILVAHGSRDARWREPFERVARELAAELRVELAFLELSPPTFPDAVARAVASGARELRVLPLLLAGGAHVERDLPALVDAARAAHPAAKFSLLTPLGADDRFWALVKNLARDS